MARVKRVIAPNPGPYTGPGTNTWVLAEPPVAVVIDPGPDDREHQEAIITALEGLPLGVILVTHSHPDHLPLAEPLALATGARVARHPELADGDVVRIGSLALEVLYTPGHASDHLCFRLAADGAVFTGDLVLGRGSTMVTHPDGDMAAYLDSLARLRALEPRLLFPGHWDPVKDPMAKLDEYRTHRLRREEQVLAAVAESKDSTPADLTRRVYGAEVSDPDLLRAAQMTLEAHLDKLERDGRISRRRGPSGDVFGPVADRA